MLEKMRLGRWAAGGVDFAGERRIGVEKMRTRGRR
jgi:hypothetical protein